MSRQDESAPFQRLPLALLIAFFLVAGVGLNSLSPSLKLVSSAGTAVLIFGWFVFRRRTLPAGALILTAPYGILLAVQAISLLWTPLPRPGLELWLQGFLLFAFFLFVVSTVVSGWSIRLWLEAILLTVAGLCLVELLLAGSWLLRWRSAAGEFSPLPPIGYRASGLLVGHPNVLSGLINLAVPLAILFLWRARSASRRISFAAMLILLAATQYLTSSRTGWISLTTSLLALGTLFLWIDLRGERSLRQLFRRVTSSITPLQWGGLIATTAGLLYAVFWQISRTGHAPISRARFPVWEAAYNIIQEAPVLGSGFGSFPPLFAQQSLNYDVESVPHAHNLLLQLLVDSGLPGVVLVGLFAILLGGAGYTQWCQADLEERRFLAVLFAVGVAVLTHHLADYLFGPPMYTMSVLALVGIFVGSAARNLDRLRDLGDWHMGPWLAGAAVLAVIGIGVLQAGAWDHWEAALAGRANQWRVAEQEACESLLEEPGVAAYAHTCAIARSYAAVQEGDSPPFIGASKQEHVQAADADPYWYLHWANAGVAARAEGDFAAAAKFLDLAIEKAPHSAELILNRGYVEDLRGNQDLAGSYYRLAARREPWIVRSSFIQSSGRRQDAVAGLRLDRYLDGDQPLLWWCYQALRDGHLEVADRMLTAGEQRMRRNARVYAFRAQYYLRTGALRRARSSAAAARFIRPTDPWIEWTWAEVVRALDGDEQAEERIADAVISYVNMSDSQRYYFAAHRRFSLQLDLHPMYVRSQPPEALVQAAAAVLEGSDLGHERRWAFEVFLNQSGYRDFQPREALP